MSTGKFYFIGEGDNMDSHDQNFIEEKDYLEKTISLIEREIQLESEILSKRRKELISARKDMWEDAVHYVDDFEKLTEVTQHLGEITHQTATYGSSERKLEKYKKLLASPYFGRFDFKEDGYEQLDKVYIGLHNLTDPETNDIYVYDWRAPISSIFYRFEPGRGAYNAPFGVIEGDVLLKRQYKIQNSSLKYFFDCSITINDDMLQEALSRNSSTKMKNIVETIQREQDIIIRDMENELLIVQGIAGSGKTSVALHRIAFLMYQGTENRLGFNNIIIISPNSIFSKYISGVLPELGEENVGQTTLGGIFNKFLSGKANLCTRNMQIEAILYCRSNEQRNYKIQSIEFKGSSTFITILDRLLYTFEHRILQFQDIYYSGMIIKNRQQLKNEFLNNKTNMPMAKRLKRMENRIWDSIHPLQKERLKKIVGIVQRGKRGHDFEIKPFSRLISIKETKALMDKMHEFTEVDPLMLYKMLFSNRELFYKLAGGLKLPHSIESMINDTACRLEEGQLYYEDCAPLLYLKLKMEGCDNFRQIRQVIIDEAQDYYPLHYEIFKLLFNDAKFTVLGDISQSIENNAQISLYDNIIEILNKKKSVKLTLNKSYRASYEINAFAQKIQGNKQLFFSFERHENEPALINKETKESLDNTLLQDIADCLNNGFETAAILCRTNSEAAELYGRLNGHMNIKLFDSDNDEVMRGVMIMPVYMSKGLEFDCVFIYGADTDNYSTELDRRLLYIACTRALHVLRLYYTGEKSSFI